MRSSVKSGSSRWRCQAAIVIRPPAEPGADTEEPRRAPEGARTGSSIGTEERRAGMSLPRCGLVVDAALAQSGGLADALAQEVELGAASHAVAHDFDLLDSRAVHLEGSLDAHTAGDAADG